MPINTQAIVLKLLLQSSQDSEAILDFDAAKSEYFSDSYKKIRKYIAEFHAKYNKLPNLTELKVQYNRSSTILSTLEALDKQEIPEDVELSVAVEALESEYAQQLTLTTFKEQILKDITILDSQEVVERLSILQTTIADALDTSDKVFTASGLSVFQTAEESDLETIITGISDRWDNDYGASRRQDLLLLGGKRGSGKSVVCINFAVNQYKQGNICPYFTIEMTAGETYQRYLANLAGVSAMGIRNKDLTTEEIFKLSLVMADMFEGGMEVLGEFLDEVEEYSLSTFAILDSRLRKLPEKVPTIVIIDDSELRLASIDAHLSTLKAKYGDKLTMAVVDYVNQVIVDDQSLMYDWKDQLIVAKGLKNQARKHDLVMVSPYQIDKDGEARLSKAILDPADYAMVIHANDTSITLEATKVRSISNVTFNVPMNWHDLKLSKKDIARQDIHSLVGSDFSSAPTGQNNAKSFGDYV